MYTAADGPPEFPEGPPRDWPDRQHSALIDLHGVRWHVQQMGQIAGSAPTVLLLHGTGGGTHSWAGVIPGLTPHAHVVALDLPGHAFTHVPASVERASNPYALPGMARLLRSLLEHLGVRPDLIVGHSAGTSVALRLVLDGGVAPRHIIGVCPALVPPPAWYVAFIAPLLGFVVESDTVAATAARLAAGTRIVQQMLASTGTTLTAEQLARYRLLCTKPEHVHAALTMMARWDLPALLRDVSTLRTPVHLLPGKGDRWIPVAPLTRAVQRIPGLTTTVEEGGHLLPEERPEVVVREILVRLGG